MLGPNMKNSIKIRSHFLEHYIKLLVEDSLIENGNVSQKEIS